MRNLIPIGVVTLFALGLLCAWYLGRRARSAHRARYLEKVRTMPRAAKRREWRKHCERNGEIAYQDWLADLHG